MNQKLAEKIRSKPLLAVIGPTASGKTALACSVYDQLGGADRVSLISVDSALVYKKLNIGTAKPTAKELSLYPHELVDVAEPTQNYSVAEFVKDALTLVDQAQSAGKLPVLVGGTMMYFRAFLGGLDTLPEANLEIRATLEALLSKHGNAYLHKQLTKLDPESAKKINQADTQRLMRALEFVMHTKTPLSQVQTKPKLVSSDQWKLCALAPERSVLHERIDQRLQIMWRQGFVDEVKSLVDEYPEFDSYGWSRAVGYRQVIERIKAEPSFSKVDAELHNKALFATRQMAKRQYTWMRGLKREVELSFHSAPETALPFLLHNSFD